MCILDYRMALEICKHGNVWEFMSISKELLDYTLCKVMCLTSRTIPTKVTKYPKFKKQLFYINIA